MFIDWTLVLDLQNPKESCRSRRHSPIFIYEILESLWQSKSKGPYDSYAQPRGWLILTASKHHKLRILLAMVHIMVSGMKNPDIHWNLRVNVWVFSLGSFTLPILRNIHEKNKWREVVKLKYFVKELHSYKIQYFNNLGQVPIRKLRYFAIQ